MKVTKWEKWGKTCGLYIEYSLKRLHSSELTALLTNNRPLSQEELKPMLQLGQSQGLCLNQSPNKLNASSPITFFILTRSKKSQPAANSTYYLNKGEFLCPICGKNYSCPSALNVSDQSIWSILVILILFCRCLARFWCIFKPS